MLPFLSPLFVFSLPVLIQFSKRRPSFPILLSFKCWLPFFFFFFDSSFYCFPFSRLPLRSTKECTVFFDRLFSSRGLGRGDLRFFSLFRYPVFLLSLVVQPPRKVFWWRWVLPSILWPLFCLLGPLHTFTPPPHSLVLVLSLCPDSLAAFIPSPTQSSLFTLLVHSPFL